MFNIDNVCVCFFVPQRALDSLIDRGRIDRNGVNGQLDEQGEG